MNNQRPSLFRILVLDYYTFMAYLITIIGWVIFYANRTDPESNMLYIAIGVTCAAVLVFLWRLYTFIKIFDSGVETPAIIQRFLYARIHGRIEYTYTYQGVEYNVHDDVVKYTGVREIAIGLQVTALVNPNNPKKAVINELFAKR